MSSLLEFEVRKDLFHRWGRWFKIRHDPSYRNTTGCYCLQMKGEAILRPLLGVHRSDITEDRLEKAMKSLIFNHGIL